MLATNMEEVQAAYDKGAAAVSSELDTIQTALTRAVTALAPNYELDEAYTKIRTLSQAGEVQASMNFA